MLLVVLGRGAVAGTLVPKAGAAGCATAVFGAAAVGVGGAAGAEAGVVVFIAGVAARGLVAEAYAARGAGPIFGGALAWVVAAVRAVAVRAFTLEGVGWAGGLWVCG